MSVPGVGPAAGRLALDDLAATAAATIVALGSSAGLLWDATPTALLDHRPVQAGRPGTRPVVAWARTLASGLRRSRGARFVTVGNVLFAYEGANPEGTLRPVIDELARRRSQPAIDLAIRPSPRALADGLRQLRPTRAALLARLGPPLPASFDAALHAAVRAGARARSALDLVRPALVVVASQHSTASRALLRIARERRVPTGYLPHAPAADTHQYRDLPTDFAALRGPREVELYRALGVTGELAVAGNPQIDVAPPDALDPDLAVVYAPRPLSAEVVRAQVADVQAASDSVVVSPHPRMRSEVYDRLWPAHWEVHRGPTVELLRQGHPCVVQLSSGVAWEAMAHGVPVVELPAPGGGGPLYPLIRPPYARVCTSSADVVAAVHEARREAPDAEGRRRLMAWAGEWCQATGAEAADLAAACVEDWAGRGPVPGPLLDRWAPGEVS